MGNIIGFRANNPLSQTNEAAATRVYHALERLIGTLEPVPRSVATNGALIERLWLWRTPVRDAIQRLAWEGLDG